MRKEIYKNKFSTTDNTLSAKAFFNAIDRALVEAQEHLLQLSNAQDEIDFELKSLLTGFYVQESVKDIQFINPEVGFKGGTLGGDWESALNNLLKMYETGGLNPIDYQWLRFAILNSSSAFTQNFIVSRFTASLTVECGFLP